MQAQKLIYCQAYYLKTLFKFNFKIIYRSNKQNKKANTFTYIANTKPINNQNNQIRYQY